MLGAQSAYPKNKRHFSGKTLIFAQNEWFCLIFKRKVNTTGAPSKKIMIHSDNPIG